jgi:phosphoglycolate phosphatase
VGNLRRLIVFDLDGTLIDSRRDLADSANALIAARGGTLQSEEAVGRMVGEGAAVLVRRALTAAGLEMDDSSLPQFLELYDERLLRSTRPYDGVEEALTKLAGFSPLAVLTNKPIGPTRKVLAGLQLERFFAAAVGGDGPLARKPSPDGLTYLIAEFDVLPERTVMVGDSPIDAAVARAAGTRFCLAAYGYGAEAIDQDVVASADAVAHTPSDLPAVLSPLLG